MLFPVPSLIASASPDTELEKKKRDLERLTGTCTCRNPFWESSQTLRVAGRCLGNACRSDLRFPQWCSIPGTCALITASVGLIGIRLGPWSGGRIPSVGFPWLGSLGRVLLVGFLWRVLLVGFPWSGRRRVLCPAKASRCRVPFHRRSFSIALVLLFLACSPLHISRSL